jgi:hypothetical protein
MSMADPAKAAPKNPARLPERKTFKYPSEDETFVRRLGSAVLANWSALPADVRDKLLSEAVGVWDREYNIPQLPQKLDAFVKRYPGRLS